MVHTMLFGGRKPEEGQEEAVWPMCSACSPYAIISPHYQSLPWHQEVKPFAHAECVTVGSFFLIIN